jgi:hypothetical protein
VQIKKFVTAVDSNSSSESDMSGRSLRGKMSRQNALDHQDGDDHTKEEREKHTGEKRTDVAEREPQAAAGHGRQQQMVKSGQAEDTSIADSSFISNPPKTRHAWK